MRWKYLQLIPSDFSVKIFPSFFLFHFIFLKLASIQTPFLRFFPIFSRLKTSNFLFSSKVSLCVFNFVKIIIFLLKNEISFLPSRVRNHNFVGSVLFRSFPIYEFVLHRTSIRMLTLHRKNSLRSLSETRPPKEFQDFFLSMVTVK